MTLYEIDRKIADAIDYGCDPETGEVIDSAALSALKMERDAKIEGIALYIKNLRAEAEALKSEKQAFEKRQRAAERKADGLKAYLDGVLDGKKFKTTRVSVSFRNQADGRCVIDDAAAVPDSFRKPGEPNVSLIKAALKDGVPVAGAHLENSHSLILK